jgi:hypothetical protein
MESVKILFEKLIFKKKIILFSCCLGCSFESNDNEFLYTGGNIAIEWESSAYYLRYLSSREQVSNKMIIEISLDLLTFIGC